MSDGIVINNWDFTISGLVNPFERFPSTLCKVYRLFNSARSIVSYKTDGHQQHEPGGGLQLLPVVPVLSFQCYSATCIQHWAGVKNHQFTPFYSLASWVGEGLLHVVVEWQGQFFLSINFLLQLVDTLGCIHDLSKSFPFSESILLIVKDSTDTEK